MTDAPQTLLRKDEYSNNVISYPANITNFVFKPGVSIPEIKVYYRLEDMDGYVDDVDSTQLQKIVKSEVRVRPSIFHFVH